MDRKGITSIPLISHYKDRLTDGFKMRTGLLVGTLVSGPVSTQDEFAFILFFKLVLYEKMKREKVPTEAETQPEQVFPLLTFSLYCTVMPDPMTHPNPLWTMHASLY